MPVVWPADAGGAADFRAWVDRYRSTQADPDAVEPSSLRGGEEGPSGEGAPLAIDGGRAPTQDG